MFLEHFIYGLFSNGYQLLKSPDVDTLLNRGNLDYLIHLGDRREEDITIQIWFPEQGLLTISSIHPTVDCYGRKGTLNHTIIVTINDYIELTQPSNIFKNYFIHSLELDTIPEKLEPIQINF